VVLRQSREASWKAFGKKIRFYAPSFIQYENRSYRAPSFAFPSISITGNACSLGCKHCRGKVLETMIPATNPEELLSLCRELSAKGISGCLISGGCLPDGSVPLDPFVEAMSRIKKDLGLTVAVHTGIIGKETAKKLAGAGVDVALIDVIGSDETIREIYRLNVTVGDYEDSLRALEAAKIPFVPHLIVGLHYGKLLGESRALDMMARHTPNGLVIIALIPLRGTPLHDAPAPEPSDVAHVIAEARFKMPGTPLALGCMRPKGMHRALTDVLAVEAGVNGIAFPAEEAIRRAETFGLETSFLPICCSQIFEDFRRGTFTLSRTH
jgi:lipoyl synthase